MGYILISNLLHNHWFDYHETPYAYIVGSTRHAVTGQLQLRMNWPIISHAHYTNILLSDTECLQPQPVHSCIELLLLHDGVMNTESYEEYTQNNLPLYACIQLT